MTDGLGPSTTPEPAAPQGWRQENLAHLDAAILRIRRRLEHAYLQRQRIGGLAPPTAPVEDPAPPRPGEGPYALEVLAELFDLSPFEQDLLVLAAAVELSAEVAHLCMELQQRSDRPTVTFGLALAVLPDAHWSALQPDAPLRAYDLLETEASEASAGLALRPLRAPEAVIHFLLGSPALDPRLAALLDPVEPQPLWPAQAEAAVQAARLISVPKAPAAHLAGDPAQAAAVAAGAAEAVGRRLYRLPGELIPTDAPALELFRRRWGRDARLMAGVLLIAADGAGPAQAAAVAQLVERLEGPLFLTGAPPAAAGAPGARPVARLDVPPPAPDEVAAAWTAVLSPLGDAATPLARRLSDQFRLEPPLMAAVARAGLETPPAATGPESPETVGARIWELCRLQGREALGGLAQRIECKARFEDLVLPDETRNILDQIVARRRNQARVLQDWGLAQRVRGVGLSVLFAGGSGTGKTMAAEVIADALQLDLYRIDLASVVDKYIGETEKNLRRVFDAAERSGAVLLFDEADALFGKRGDVKDSHDRYANLEVGYLLQRVEAYPGVAILTTNLPDSIDPAFQRRFAFVAQFPFPAEAQRRELWARVFPAATPREPLDLDRLARLPLSGGQIVSIALNAAFAAAEQGRPVGDAHLDDAVRLEFGKQSRTPPLALPGGTGPGGALAESGAPEGGRP